MNQAAVVRDMPADVFAKNLQRWAATCDPHVAAAVQLLVDGDHWTRNAKLRQYAEIDVDGLVFLNWSQLRKAVDGGEFNAASSTERAMLDLAVALGENRYRFSIMGDANSRMVVRAVSKAVGIY